MPLQDCLNAIGSSAEAKDYLAYILGTRLLLLLYCWLPPFRISNLITHPNFAEDHDNQNVVTKGDWLGASSLFGSPKTFVANVRVLSWLAFNPTRSRD